MPHFLTLDTLFGENIFFGIYRFQDNQRKPYGLPTEQQTDRQTDIGKTIYPFLFEGGIKIYIILI